MKRGLRLPDKRIGEVGASEGGAVHVCYVASRASTGRLLERTIMKGAENGLRRANGTVVGIGMLGERQSSVRRESL